MRGRSRADVEDVRILCFPGEFQGGLQTLLYIESADQVRAVEIFQRLLDLPGTSREGRIVVDARSGIRGQEHEGVVILGIAQDLLENVGLVPASSGSRDADASNRMIQSAAAVREAWQRGAVTQHQIGVILVLERCETRLILVDLRGRLLHFEEDVLVRLNVLGVQRRGHVAAVGEPIHPPQPPLLKGGSVVRPLLKGGERR